MNWSIRRTAVGEKQGSTLIVWEEDSRKEDDLRNKALKYSARAVSIHLCARISTLGVVCDVEVEEGAQSIGEDGLLLVLVLWL